MESVASTLDFIRKQSAARRSDYNDRWKVDVDVNKDAGTDADDDKKGRSHFAVAPLVPPRPLVEADDPSSFIGDHMYEYAASPTTSTSAVIPSSAAHRTRGKYQRCVVEYYPPGNAATATDFTIGSQDRSVSSYVRATATDASVYSRASYSDYSLPSSAPTPRSTTDRLHRAGSLLQGLSYAELDLPVNADAVDRLRAKLSRLPSENSCGIDSQSQINGIGARNTSARASASITNRPVPSIVDCIPGSSASAVETTMVASFPTRSRHLPHPPSRPCSAMSAISSASRFSASTSTTASKKRPHPTTSTTCVFDPSMMQGSRRAALKAEKRVKDEAAAKAKERRMRLFKARPLPCGGTVTSNLFAPTMASTNARASGMANLHSIVSALPASMTAGNGSPPGTSHSKASRASFSSLPASLS